MELEITYGLGDNMLGLEMEYLQKLGTMITGDYKVIRGDSDYGGPYAFLATADFYRAYDGVLATILKLLTKESIADAGRSILSMHFYDADRRDNKAIVVVTLYAAEVLEEVSTALPQLITEIQERFHLEITTRVEVSPRQ